ncbi:MAG: hypothetical protein JNL98_27565 [Bryobacterales bacterium]|nr:hypothetical protein [Bryobacterales bacterium]
MRFAKYWAARDQRRDSFHLKVWGWSDQSFEHALSVASARLDSVLRKVDARGELPKYPYGSEHPLREEILDTIPRDGTGEPQAVLTRNSYGSVVLNAARVLFADLDSPEPPQDVAGSASGAFWKRLFDGREAAPAPPKTDACVARVEAFCRSNPQLAVRLYRTFAGYRAVILNRTYDPQDSAVSRMLKDLGSDPLYIKLCEGQQCFRARLTPKPWRCGEVPPGVTYPYSERAKRRLGDWLKVYERACAKYGVCELVRDFGPRQVEPEVERVLAVHDRYAVREGLPLA